MRVAGWTLIVMAVMLHFSVCEWGLNGYDESSCIVPFLPFVQAREQFATHHTGFHTTFNTMAAGLWGLVIPLGLAVAGISLILRDPRPTILRRVGGWLHSARDQWLRRWVVALGVAVILALLMTIPSEAQTSKTASVGEPPEQTGQQPDKVVEKPAENANGKVLDPVALYANCRAAVATILTEDDSGFDTGQGVRILYSQGVGGTALP